MARKVNPFKIGLFGLICLALIVGAIVWLKVSAYFQDTKTYVCYFNESVKGLQPDAAVNYRGVPIGRVRLITLAPDGRLIEVRLALQSDFHVDQDVAVQLRDQGLTGLRFLEIDKAPENIGEITPKISFDPKYPVLKSYPSELAQLKNALQTIYEKVNELDVKTLMESWTRTADLINGVLIQIGAEPQIGDLRTAITAIKQTAQYSADVMERVSKATSQKQIERIVKDLNATLASTRQASESLARQMKSMPPDALKRISSDLGETMRSGASVLSTVQGKIGESSNLLEQNLQQLKALLTQLNGLIQALQEQPNRLVFPSKAQKEPLRKKAP
ncbi:MAG: MlaD family protein [Desulfobacteraceae bacterium]|nr:MlaD family protein [Desulfobacteraceae bacterium]